MVALQFEILPETLKHILDVCERYKTRVMWNYAPAREFDTSYSQESNDSSGE